MIIFLKVLKATIYWITHLEVERPPSLSRYITYCEGEYSINTWVQVGGSHGKQVDTTRDILCKKTPT